MVEFVRLALRITDEDFDSEIEMLIGACHSELVSLGIIDKDEEYWCCDDRIKNAVVAYCKFMFGENKESERWENIYRGIIDELKKTTGYGVDADVPE